MIALPLGPALIVIVVLSLGLWAMICARGSKDLVSAVLTSCLRG